MKLNPITVNNDKLSSKEGKIEGEWGSQDSNLFESMIKLIVDNINCLFS